MKILPSCLSLLVAVFSVTVSAAADGDVLTQGYDRYRTGAQLEEKLLDSRNVRPQTFGRIGSLAVDGAVHTQPLIINRLSSGDGRQHDVAYITTANNSVFAFDVTDATAQVLWTRHLTTPDDDRRDIGILGTPVIDRTAHTLYVVSAQIDHHRGRYMLHALDLRDGSDRHDSPVAIEGSVRIDGREVAFEPTDRRIAVQRAALALAGGKVIVAFGGDFFEGWVFAFDTADLRKAPAAFCTTCVSHVKEISHVDYLSPDCTFIGPAGGIWQSGRAPVVDDNGKVYFFTGNKAHIVRQGCLIPPGRNACAQCTTPGGCPCEGVGEQKVCRGPDTCIANRSQDGASVDAHEALVRLDPANALRLEALFRPANWNAEGVHGLEFNDLDLGGSGPLLIPGTTHLVGGGKEGVLYLLDSDAPAQPLQSFAVSTIPNPPLQYYRHILGGPVLWPGGADGETSLLYIWRMNDHLRSYRVTDRFVDCDHDDVQPSGTERCLSHARSAQRIDHHPGGILAVSADGSRPDSGIVWAYTSLPGNGPGKLMAFAARADASAPDRLVELWDSDICPGDAIESGVTFAPPTVSNGRVYVATAANRVDVFGLMPARECDEAKQPEVSEHLLNF